MNIKPKCAYHNEQILLGYLFIIDEAYLYDY